MPQREPSKWGGTPPVGLLVGMDLLHEYEDMTRLFAHRVIRTITADLTNTGPGVVSVSANPAHSVPEICVLVVVGDTPADPIWRTQFPGVPVVIAGYPWDDPAVAAVLEHGHEAYSAQLVEHLLDQRTRKLAILRHPGAPTTTRRPARLCPHKHGWLESKWTFSRVPTPQMTPTHSPCRR